MLPHVHRRTPRRPHPRLRRPRRRPLLPETARRVGRTDQQTIPGSMVRRHAPPVVHAPPLPPRGTRRLHRLPRRLLPTPPPRRKRRRRRLEKTKERDTKKSSLFPRRDTHHRTGAVRRLEQTGRPRAGRRRPRLGGGPSPRRRLGRHRRRGQAPRLHRRTTRETPRPHQQTSRRLALLPPPRPPLFFHIIDACSPFGSTARFGGSVSRCWRSPPPP
mmetsp:Transcript_17211/g.55851  ORF Transcript_17211/g.55851 Transcript_17211/m.55851 type:complete len:216 (+) Transcript_17211:619-1266(+)